MRSSTLKNNHGFSILGVLIAAAIATIVALTTSQLLNGFFRSIASFEQRGEVADAKQMVRTRLSCRETFPTGSCPSAAGPIRLLDKFGREIFPDTAPIVAGAVATPELRYHKVRIQTLCRENRLELRFANPSISYLATFPTPPQMELCQEVLGGTTNFNCPNGQHMVGIRPDTLEPNCAPTPAPSPRFVGSFFEGYNDQDGVYCIYTNPHPQTNTGIREGCYCPEGDEVNISQFGNAECSFYHYRGGAKEGKTGCGVRTVLCFAR